MRLSFSTPRRISILKSPTDPGATTTVPPDYVVHQSPDLPITQPARTVQLSWLQQIAPGDWLKIITLIVGLVAGWVRLGDRMNVIESHLTAIDGYMQRHEQREIEDRREIARALENRFDREREITNRDIDGLRASVNTQIEGQAAAANRTRPRIRIP